MNNLGICLVNLKKEPDSKYDLYIGRKNSFRGLVQSKWANPFVLNKESEREGVLLKYKNYVLRNKTLYNSLEELEGKTLACWCYPKRCHGDMLIELLKEKKNERFYTFKRFFRKRLCFIKF